MLMVGGRDLLRRRRRGQVIIGHRQGDGVRSACQVPARRADGRRAGAVTEGPGVGHRAVDVEVDVFVNVQVSPLQDGVNDAVGGTFGAGAVAVDRLRVRIGREVVIGHGEAHRVCPPAVYVCDGLSSVEVAPSPKLQAWVIVPSASVDVLVNAQVRPEHDALNDAGGGLVRRRRRGPRVAVRPARRPRASPGRPPMDGSSRRRRREAVKDGVEGGLAVPQARLGGSAAQTSARTWLKSRFR